jgi:hypothetical protein
MITKPAINSLVRTYAKNDDEIRAIWYAYVSNVNAYNIQYKENAKLEFDMNIYENISSMTLGMLHYNIYTNDGNHFMQEKLFKIFCNIVDRVNALSDDDAEVLAAKYNVNVKEYEI